MGAKKLKVDRIIPRCTRYLAVWNAIVGFGGELLSTRRRYMSRHTVYSRVYNIRPVRSFKQKKDANSPEDKDYSKSLIVNARKGYFKYAKYERKS